MSYLDSERLAAEWLATQSNRKIDYAWEIQHHREMHEAYERSLQEEFQKTI